MVIIGEAQMIGNFLDRHGGFPEQIHGYLQPKRLVVTIGSRLVFPFKHVIGPGAGQVGAGGNFVNADSPVNVPFNKALHGQGRGLLFLMLLKGVCK